MVGAVFPAVLTITSMRLKGIFESRGREGEIIRAGILRVRRVLGIDCAGGGILAGLPQIDRESPAEADHGGIARAVLNFEPLHTDPRG